MLQLDLKLWRVSSYLPSLSHPHVSVFLIGNRRNRLLRLRAANEPLSHHPTVA